VVEVEKDACHDGVLQTDADIIVNEKAMKKILGLVSYVQILPTYIDHALIRTAQHP